MNVFKWDKYNKIKRAGVEIGGRPYLLSEAETPAFIQKYGGGKSLEQLGAYGGSTSATSVDTARLLQLQTEEQQNVAARQFQEQQRLANEGLAAQPVAPEPTFQAAGFKEPISTTKYYKGGKEIDPTKYTNLQPGTSDFENYLKEQKIFSTTYGGTEGAKASSIKAATAQTGQQVSTGTPAEQRDLQNFAGQSLQQIADQGYQVSGDKVYSNGKLIGTTTPTEQAPTKLSQADELQIALGRGTPEDLKNIQFAKDSGLLATMTSADGTKKVQVAIGSQKANDLFGQGYTLGDKPGGGTLTSKEIANVTKVDITDMAGDTGKTGSVADEGVASATEEVSNLESRIEELENLSKAPETDTSKTVDQLLEDAGISAGELTGRGDMQATEEDKRQIEEKRDLMATTAKELKKKLASIKALEASFNLENQIEEGRPQTLSRLRGQQAQNYKMFLAQKNLLVSEASYLEADLLGQQGEIEAAQNAANRAVDLEYSDRQAEFNAKINQLNILIPQLDKEELRYANNFKFALQEEANALAEQKQAKKDEISRDISMLSGGYTYVKTPAERDSLIAKGYNIVEVGGKTYAKPPEKGKFQLSYDPLSGESIVFNPETGGLSGGQVATSTGEVLDISNYATDPAHPSAIQSLLDTIGQFNTPEDIDNYIKSVSPDSSITSDMIQKASEENQISWESLVAMLQHESALGTSNVAENNNNVGGITWTGTNGQKGTARPSAEGGNYVRYDTLQEGINAVASNLSRRVVSPAQSAQQGYQPTGNVVLDGLVQGALDNPENLKTYSQAQKTAVTATLAKQGLSVYPPGGSIVGEENLREAILSLSAGQQESAFSAIASFKNAEDILDLLDKGVETGPIAGRKLTGIDIAGFPITPGEQALGKSTKEQDEMLASMTAFSANFIKAISGVAVSAKEYERLMNALPSVNRQENVNRNSLRALLDTIQNKYGLQLGMDLSFLRKEEGGDNINNLINNLSPEQLQELKNEELI